MEYTMSISGGTPESRQLHARIQRAIRLTEQLNRLPFDETQAIRDTWSELTGQPVDPTFSLIPPVYSDHGLTIRVGRNVFINQACVLNDIGDDVMIGPRVSLLTSGHPLDPTSRRRQIVAAPIVVERNVWIGAGRGGPARRHRRRGRSDRRRCGGHHQRAGRDPGRRGPGTGRTSDRQRRRSCRHRGPALGRARWSRTPAPGPDGSPGRTSRRSCDG